MSVDLPFTCAEINKWIFNVLLIDYIFYIRYLYFSKQILSNGKKLYDNSIDLDNKRIYYLLFCINIYIINIFHHKYH